MVDVMVVTYVTILKVCDMRGHFPSRMMREVAVFLVLWSLVMSVQKREHV